MGIIEVNGVNVNLENHRQVVQRIKAVPGETRLLVVDQKSEAWHRDRHVLVKASLPYVIHLSSEKVDTSDRDGTELRPSADHNEVFEEVTIIETNGPATGVDVVLTEEATEEATGVDVLLTQPDPEEARQSMEESVGGETNEENLVISEQASLDETDEDLSHLEVGTNKELLMVEEVAKEEEDVGSDKQESEEEEEEEMEHDPPA